MMNKKGIEGLPLKYLAIALVGSLVIAVALQMTGTIQSSVTGATELLADKTTGMVIDATRGDTYVTGFNNLGILSWNFNSSDGRLKVSFVNDGSSVVNIDSITASFNGVDDVSTADRQLLPGESTIPVALDLSSAVSYGDAVSISVSVLMSDASYENGTLVGIAQ